VKNELFAKGLPPSEEDYLTQGLRPWETISWHPRAARLSGGLSASDISVLEIAKKMNSEWVLADEKPLRQVLSVRRHKVIGTLGILLMARRQDIISLKQTHEMVDELVSAHRFRISAEIYRSFLKILSEP
jgi:predicted nucleic acid-binding protein